MGYAHNITKLKLESDPFEVSPESNVSIDQSFEDCPVTDSFFDSLLNFDGWVEDHSNLSLAGVMNSEEKPNLDITRNSLEPNKQEGEEEVCRSEKLADLGSLIQEGMVRVCLTSSGEVIDGTDGGENGIRDDVKQESKIQEVVGSDGVKCGNENEVKSETAKVEGNEDVKDCGVLKDSPEKSTSSSSSSSSSDDDDDDDDDDEEDDDDEMKKVKNEIEMEEGEIREQVIAWSDDEDGDVVKGPIRSKNEVQDLPPVPPVNVTIQPHHQTLPVGIVLSIMGAQVVVEGAENHNPLSEGSILWITESRSPLGVVDEIFGPVKNPYYIVRYNSETEIPTGIQQGSLVSFVPEFADYVLNNNNLYKKGYDASGENDEEISEEFDFSDDEKEAEHKKMIKMSKRGTSEQKNGRAKKDKKSRNRVGNWKNNPQHLVNSQVNGSFGGSASGPQPFSPVQQGQVNSQVNCSSDGPTGGPQAFPPVQHGLVNSQVNGSAGGPASGPQAFSPVQQGLVNSQVNGSAGGPTGGPHAFSPVQHGLVNSQVNGSCGLASGPQAFSPIQQGVWPNGFPHMQPPNVGFPSNAFPPNVQFMQPNFIQQPFPNFGAPNITQFHPQFNTSGPLFPPNFGTNPAFVSWPIGMPQNNFNQTQVRPPLGLPQMPNGLQMENRPPFVTGTSETSHNVNQAKEYQNRGGRKPFQRGGGRFRGGRNGPQSR